MKLYVLFNFVCLTTIPSEFIILPTKLMLFCDKQGSIMYTLRSAYCTINMTVKFLNLLRACS